MRFPPLLSAVLVSGCVTAASANAPLEGVWGALGVALTASSEGGMIEESCSQLSFGPILPGADGRFTAAGRYTAWQGGPQRADERGDSGQPVALSGSVDGDRMELRITVSGQEPRDLVLRRGLRSKIIRCL